MLSRIRGPKTPSPSRSKKGVSATATDGVGSLIGDTGVSLDGESLMLPGDGGGKGPRDDESSIGTSNYGGPSRPMKSFDVTEGDEPSMLGLDENSVTRPPPPPPPPPPKVITTPVDLDEMDESREGMVPNWVKAAPPYFRIIIIVSIALLVGAVVLVIVAAVLASNDNDSPDSISSLTFPPTIPTPATSMPSSAPSTAMPSAAPSTSEPTVTPVPTITPSPTRFPTVSPSASPTQERESSSPTDVGENIVTFYAIAGRFQGATAQRLPRDLGALPDDDGRSFLVHLGDWNSPSLTNCSKASYDAVDTLYSNTSVPTFFVVGDNEYNDCTDQDEALEFWYDSLLEYETVHWPASEFYTVTRQSDGGYPENFSFFYQGIIFVGINLVGGENKDPGLWDQRLEANLDWIVENVESFPDAQTMVIFAHSDPDIQVNAEFFASFYEAVNDDYGLNVKFIHRNLGVETAKIETVEGVDNLELVVVQGQLWPPLQVRISAGGDVFTIDQSDWFENEVGVRL